MDDKPEYVDVGPADQPCKFGERKGFALLFVLTTLVALVLSIAAITGNTCDCDSGAGPHTDVTTGAVASSSLQQALDTQQQALNALNQTLNALRGETELWQQALTEKAHGIEATVEASNTTIELKLAAASKAIAQLNDTVIKTSAATEQTIYDLNGKVDVNADLAQTAPNRWVMPKTTYMNQNSLAEVITCECDAGEGLAFHEMSSTCRKFLLDVGFATPTSDKVYCRGYAKRLSLYHFKGTRGLGESKYISSKSYSTKSPAIAYQFRALVINDCDGTLIHDLVGSMPISDSWKTYTYRSMAKMDYFWDEIECGASKPQTTPFDFDFYIAMPYSSECVAGTC